MLWRDEPTPEQLRLRRLLIALGVLAVVAFFVFAVRYVNRGAPDETTRFSDIAPFRMFESDGQGGWLGMLGPGWPGIGDPAAIDRVCTALRQRIPAGPEVRIELVSSEAEPVAVCK